jgi:hypothetical protein
LAVRQPAHHRQHGTVLRSAHSGSDT